MMGKGSGLFRINKRRTASLNKTLSPIKTGIRLDTSTPSAPVDMSGSTSTILRRLSLSSVGRLLKTATVSRMLTSSSLNASGSQPSSISYDTSIGNGVDSDGYASLPLDASATRYFVGPGGSDSNDGLTHATRLATLSAGVNKVVSGRGDHVLVAEGSNLNETMPWLAFKWGKDATHPTVISSYDPNDPLNTSKYGRGDQRHARPILSASGSAALVTSGLGPKYVVIKGFDFNPGNPCALSFVCVSHTSPDASDYILIENNLFRNCGVSADQGSSSVGNPAARNIIIRNNAFTGLWNTNGVAGSIYISGYVNVTVEDNVTYHSGWKLGASRDDNYSIGGPTVFSHATYLQTDTYNGVCRRNLIIEPASGTIARGDIDFNNNVVLRAPDGIGLGGGPDYNRDRPSGVNIQASYNLLITSGDLTSTALRGTGFTTSNGLPGSKVHHNILIHDVGGDRITFSNSAAFPQPSHMAFEDNIAYQWGNNYDGGGGYPGEVTTTYDRNVWDLAASGTNINNSSVTFANPYTEASLLAAAGYGSYSALVTDVTEHPELHVQRTLLSLAQAGYSH